MRLIDMAAALVTALLAGCGIGGGGLYVIWLTAVKGLPQSEAQCLNLLFFLSAALSALPFHLRKRSLPVKRILPCAVIGTAGTLLGGTLRDILGGGILRMMFGVLLITVGIRTFLVKNR